MPRPEIIEEPTEKKSHFWLFLFFIFVGIFMFILYTTFYDDGFKNPLTGRVINADIGNETVGNIAINGELSIPLNLPIDSHMKTLGIKIKGPSLLSVGNQEINLNKSSSFIIENFEGKFVITSASVLELQGSADQVFIDGIPIKEKSGMIKISFKKIDYTYVEMRGISLSSLSYPATGTINLNDGTLLVNLKEEEFYIKDFSGDIEINRNFFRINGNSRDFDANKLLKNT